MAEVFKDEMEKVHDALTMFRIGDREFELREMKIKRLKQFSELVYLAHSRLLRKLQAMRSDADVADVTDTTMEINSEVVSLLNFAFALEGEKAISKEWFEENISNRILENIISEAARQSRADWLIPFFGKFYLLAGLQIPREVISKKQVNGNPTIS